MSAAGLLPAGFRDRLPPDAEAAATLTRAVMDAVAGHGYARVQPPIAEFEDEAGAWLERPANAAAFRATDPASGRGLVFRGDITGQVARIAATRLAAAPRPLRLGYAGPVLRSHAGQIDAARERTQAGAELIGSDAPAAVREVLALAVEALRACGADDLSVDVTLPGLVAELAGGPWPHADVAGLHAALDGKDAGALRAMGAQRYEALLAAAGSAAEALPALRALGIAPDLLDEVEALVASLDCAVTVDPTERHGFEYQTRIGFSLFGAGARAEIGRGGTYALKGGEAAVGFSLYVDALVDAGLGRDARPRLFVGLGADADAAAKYRRLGFATVAALTPNESPAGCTHVLDGAEARPL